MDCRILEWALEIFCEWNLGTAFGIRWNVQNKKTSEDAEEIEMYLIIVYWIITKLLGKILLLIILICLVTKFSFSFHLTNILIMESISMSARFKAVNPDVIQFYSAQSPNGMLAFLIIID